MIATRRAAPTLHTLAYIFGALRLDPNCASLQCPRVLASVISISRWLHFVGIALAIGSAIAITICRHNARKSAPSERAPLDRLLAELVIKVELPGLAIALFAGLVAVVINPAIFTTWLFVKMPMVMVLMMVAFLKMIDASRALREPEELAAISARGAKLDVVAIALGVLILFVATFRFVLFS